MNRDVTPRPWYREPWPWVLIAIPLLTVIASGVTLWLAVSNPDYIVVEDVEYNRIRSEMRPGLAAEAEADENPEPAAITDDDG